MRRILADCAGFVYYVSVTGITGTKSAMTRDVAAGLARVRKATDLPVAVGFGVRNAGQASEIAGFADAVVVGSAIVQRIESTLVDGRAGSGTIPGVEALIRELAGGVRNRRAREAGGLVVPRVQTVLDRLDRVESARRGVHRAASAM